MYPVSARFQAALVSGAYQVVNQVVLTPTVASGMTALTLLAETGSITVDRGSAQRRQGTITLSPADPDFPMPMNIGDLLTPFGTVVQPYTGIEYSDGTTELVPLGVFILTDSEIDITASDTTCMLTVADTSSWIDEKGFLTPYQVTQTNPGAAIQAILNYVVANNPAAVPAISNFALNWTPTTATLPSPLPSFDEGAGPWASCISIAQAVGYELFYDVNNVPTGRPIPTPSSITAASANATIADGPTGITTGKRKFTRKASNNFQYSGTGSTVQPPVRGQAVDNNPASQSSIYGSLGNVPTFDSSSMVTTTAAANAAAALALNTSLGNIEIFEWTLPPNPAWDVDDVAQVTCTRGGIIDNLYIVDTVKHTMDFKTDTDITGRRCGVLV